MCLSIVSDGTRHGDPEMGGSTNLEEMGANLVQPPTDHDWLGGGPVAMVAGRFLASFPLTI